MHSFSRLVACDASAVLFPLTRRESKWSRREEKSDDSPQGHAIPLESEFLIADSQKGEALMFRLLIHWLLSAIALLLVSRVVPGFFVTGLESAMIAALVIGFLNATLGFLLKLITFPIAIITFGVFLLVINAAMILFASHLVGGFTVYGWVPAFWGAAVLSVLGLIIRAFSKE
jgi:putative membrane protein